MLNSNDVVQSTPAFLSTFALQMANHLFVIFQLSRLKSALKAAKISERTDLAMLSRHDKVMVLMKILTSQYCFEYLLLDNYLF